MHLNIKNIYIKTRLIQVKNKTSTVDINADGMGQNNNKTKTVNRYK